MGKRISLLISIILVFICLLVSSGLCNEKNPQDRSLDSTEGLIILLREKEIISDETAQFLLRQRERELNIEETEEILHKLKKIEDEMMSQEKVKRLQTGEIEIPDWLNKVRLSGDFRLRYQSDNFDPNNASFWIPEPLNSHKDRHRVRVRMRLSMIARVNEQVEIGLRLTTGNERDPVSTNETFGDYFNKDGIVFDRAYLRWHPVSRIGLLFGRMPNIFDSTDLVWDKDINLEGFAFDFNNFKTQIEKKWRFFLRAGAFPLQEVELSSKDKWLYGSQVGIKYNSKKAFGFKFAVAYYDYRNIEGRFNPPVPPYENDFTAPDYQQKGNTTFNINTNVTDTSLGPKWALATDYNLLNINGSMDFAFFSPIYIRLIADYVENIGYDREEVTRKSGKDIEETEGYQVGTSIGHLKVKDFGQWNFSVFLKHLEADAVLDAFTDSDFHLGGTNAEGWICRAQMGVGKNVWISLSWLTSDEIIDHPFAVDVLQVNLNASF